jgi:hypothetical protein
VANDPGRDRRYLQGLLALGALRAGVGLWLGFRPFDDTYITFRYARNLAEGWGFVYNRGEAVLGTTTPLWTVVLAIGHAVGVPIEAWSQLISLSADAVSALALFSLLRRLEYSRAVAAAASVLFLGFFDYLSLSRSGMESSCFVLFTCASLYAIASRRFIAAATLCSLATLTRPEGALLLSIFGVSWWWNRHLRPRTSSAAALAIVGALLTSWTLYATVTFGSPVPQSILAKAATDSRSLGIFSWTNLALFFAEGQYGGALLTRTHLQLMPLVTVLAVAGCGSLLAGVRRNALAAERLLLLFVFPAGYVAVLAIAHAFTYFPWYYAPIYPFLAVLAAIGTGALGEMVGAGVVIPTCGLLLAAQLGAAYLVKLPHDRSFWIDGYRQAAAQIPRGPDVRVAAMEIGVVGWTVWPGAVVDLVGLVTPAAVGVDSSQLIRRTLPDYLVLRTDNAAPFLEDSARDSWFAEHYTLSTRVPDPFESREFRTYRRAD